MKASKPEYVNQTVGFRLITRILTDSICPKTYIMDIVLNVSQLENIFGKEIWQQIENNKKITLVARYRRD